MEEFWKFIFGQGWAPDPPDDAEQIRREAEARVRAAEEHSAWIADQRGEAYTAKIDSERRIARYAEFNAFVDASAAEQAKPGIRAKRPGENVTIEPLPPMKAAGSLSDAPIQRGTIIPPSYYLERGVPVPEYARNLDDPATRADKRQDGVGGPR